MKINKIMFRDFRVYYGKQEIVFSVDPQKNVTLCIALNNAGKTTLTQGILWCLYGELELDEPDEVLNKIVKNEMRINDSKIVSVKIQITHKDIKYLISREQKVTRHRDGYSNDDSQISIFDLTNNRVPQKDITTFLPKALSRFFIFDGERMLHLGNNDERHKKDLKKDIRNILELDVIAEAVAHLGGWGGRGGALYELKGKLDIESTKEALELKERRDELNAILRQNNEKLTNFKNEKVEIDNKKKIVSRKLKELEYIESEQIERERIEKDVKRIEKDIESIKKNILKKTSKRYPMLFLENLFNGALDFVDKSDELNDVAPEVTAETIQYILNKEMCICGREFKKNDDTYKYLNSSVKNYPPESIGTATKRYIDALHSCDEINQAFRGGFDGNVDNYYQLLNDLSINRRKIDEISRKIDDSSIKTIKEINNQYNQISDRVDQLNKEIILLDNEIKRGKDEFDSIQKKIEEKTIVTNKNEKTKKVIKIAERIHVLLKDIYKSEEERVKNELQNEVQKIYSKVNRGLGQLEITKRYDFKISTKYNGEYIEDNAKGQGLSTVAAFAFVCGITQMVKNSIKKEDHVHINEPYPLVIDAPFSNMDTSYIKRVSEILPQYADQLVILSKDDNFNVAKEIFKTNGKIGAEWKIFLDENSDGTENQFKTIIERVI